MADQDNEVPKVAVAQMAQALTGMILEGTLKAGGRIKESVLAKEFEVSRNTVRSALSMLESTGLSRYTPNRGWVVWKPTEEDVMDVYLSRYYIETAAARTVAPGTDFTRVKAALDELVSAYDTDQVWTVIDKDIQFHRAVVELAGSSRLVEFYDRLALELRYTHLVLRQGKIHADIESWREEHLAIYRGLTSGHPEVAARAVGDQILSSRQDVRESLSVIGGRPAD